MILALFLFFGPILPAVLGHDESAELLDGRGIELGNKEQTKLLVNIADQSMARPEVGPNGRYPGAMRFKFVMLRPEQGKTCTGRILLCYPGQLDPEKNFGLSQAARHEQVTNQPNDPIAQECEKARAQCAGCTLQNTPWHGLQVQYTEDGQHLELALSTGGKHTFRVTNFTLMLHNNEVNDDADSAAFLLNDHDLTGTVVDQDTVSTVFDSGTCSDQVAFPSMTQTKIKLEGNDEKYAKYRETVATYGKLEDHKDLFLLTWDLLPFVEDQIDEVYIWMENNLVCKDHEKVTAAKIFYLGRMDREVHNFNICVTTTPEPSDAPPRFCNSTWEHIRPAKFRLPNGSFEQVVRVGFVDADKGSKFAIEQWKKFLQIDGDLMEPRSAVTANLLELTGEAGKAIRRVISHTGLELGDVIFASVQRHFNQSALLSSDDPDNPLLEARVHNCTFGLFSTYVRPLRHHHHHTHQVHPLLDWSKDFENVTKCNETRHLITRTQINVVGKKGLGKASVKQKKGKSVMTGIESSQYGKGVDKRLFLPAHMYKFRITNPHMRWPTPEGILSQEELVTKFGRILTYESDIYLPQTYKQMTAHFQKISQETVEKFRYVKKTDQDLMFKLGCGPADYCKNMKSQKKSKDECKNGNYKCRQCADKDICNGEEQSCWATAAKQSKEAFESVRKGKFHVVSERCQNATRTCLTARCSKQKSSLIWMGCQTKKYCDQALNISGCDKKTFKCEICEGDYCNGDEPCWSTNGTFMPAKTLDDPVGTKDQGCPPKTMGCVRESCALPNGPNQFMIRKSCEAKGYCVSTEVAKHREQCVEQWGGTYSCDTCDGKNVDCTLKQRCWSTGNEFVNATKEYDVNMKHTMETCKPNQNCFTETCKTKFYYMDFGVFALKYQCSANVLGGDGSFLLPRFDGRIMINGTTVASDEYRNLVTKYSMKIISSGAGIEEPKDIPVAQGNYSQCWLDFKSATWKGCAVKWTNESMLE